VLIRGADECMPVVELDEVIEKMLCANIKKDTQKYVAGLLFFEEEMIELSSLLISSSFARR